MTGEESLTDAETEEWECDIDHLISEARTSEDAYLHALAERCERLAVLWDSAEHIIDAIRKGTQCR